MSIDLEGGGQLSVEQDGGFVRCEVTRPNDGRGIYKVWVQGNTGEMLLGTLAPEGGVLRLCRRVSRDSLARAGCWPMAGGRCALVFSFQGSGWVRAAVEPRMTDPVLQRAARGLSAMFLREGDGFRMSVPFDSTKPFSFVPAFCFARVERVDGRLCAVFSFDGQGQLRMCE